MQSWLSLLTMVAEDGGCRLGCRNVMSTFCLHPLFYLQVCACVFACVCVRVCVSMCVCVCLLLTVVCAWSQSPLSDCSRRMKSTAPKTQRHCSEPTSTPVRLPFTTHGGRASDVHGVTNRVCMRVRACVCVCVCASPLSFFSLSLSLSALPCLCAPACRVVELNLCSCALPGRSIRGRHNTGDGTAGRNCHFGTGE